MTLTIFHFVGMETCCTIFFFLSLFLATLTDAQGPDCRSVRCSNTSPDISFPFYSKGQSGKCGVHGFELVCRSNTTMIKLPFHRDLVVKSISYRDRRLNLLDPGNCVHGVFLNLNLSRTPFKYHYSLNSYTYVNCSEPGIPWKSLPEIPCLSGPGYHVYTVESSRASSEVANQDGSSSCEVVKTVDIPFPYSPYLSDNSFGLGLTWESADSCGGCKGRRNREAERGWSINQITAATILILIVMALLVWVKTQNSKELDREELVLHVKKLLGDDRTRTGVNGSV